MIKLYYLTLSLRRPTLSMFKSEARLHYYNLITDHTARTPSPPA